MNIVCAVKFVPDVDSITCGIEDLLSGGSNARMILNPDDTSALAFALRVKDRNPGCRIEVVSMGPAGVRPFMEDLLRHDVDRAALISDPVFEDSDSSVTGKVLARYIATRPFDCILTGSHSLDGGTSQVPVQLAESLGLDQMTGITRIDPCRFDSTRAVFEAEYETGAATFEMAMPGILSLSAQSGCKLPYLKLADMQKDVFDELVIITNQELCFEENEIGPEGSLTEVIRTCPRTYAEKNSLVVGTDDKGITHVFNFLKRKGFL